MNLKVALVEPFYTGSHARWADDLRRVSRHSIDLFTLPGRHWKWRMHGGAVTLAGQLLSSKIQYDLILATDMLDLSTFLGLVRKRYADTPAAVYFHENQLSYPWSPRDKDTKTRNDLHYAFINYTTALNADAVFFNSDYHRRSFLSELGPFLSRYPDFENKETLDQIGSKSSTLSLGLDLQKLDTLKLSDSSANTVPLILWNHRWEYDKNPKGFCRMIHALLERNVDFEIAILGERFEEEPPYFAKLRSKLGRRLLTYGRVESFEQYVHWLWRADILPVTSAQDFFGGSVVEAVYCQTHPILPNRLAYPDHFDTIKHPEYYYQTLEEGVEKLCALATTSQWQAPCPLRSDLAAYDWSVLGEHYDNAIDCCSQKA